MNSRMIALLAGLGLAAGAHGAAHESERGARTTGTEQQRQQDYGQTQTQQQRGARQEGQMMREQQGQMTREQQQARQQQEQRSAQEAMQRLGIDEPNDIEGQTIVNAQGEEIGEVDRLARNQVTGEVVAIVGLQGMMGANMKEVPVPLAELRRLDQDRLQTALDKSQLQQRQDADPWSDQFREIEEGE